MILRSSLSVRGLYTWDNDLFTNLVVPETVDKDILCSNILSECGELEVLYPDSDYMKEIIGYWSQKELPKWNKLAETLNLEYDPLNSYRKHTIHEGTNGNTETNKVKAYNKATDYVDYKQDTNDGKNEYKRTVTGNIGIYPSQRLIGEELDMRNKYNIYDMIIRDFKLRFCLLLY